MGAKQGCCKPRQTTDNEIFVVQTQKDNQPSDLPTFGQQKLVGQYQSPQVFGSQVLNPQQFQSGVLRSQQIGSQIIQGYNGSQMVASQNFMLSGVVNPLNSQMLSQNLAHQQQGMISQNVAQKSGMISQNIGQKSGMLSQNVGMLSQNMGMLSQNIGMTSQNLINQTNVQSNQNFVQNSHNDNINSQNLVYENQQKNEQTAHYVV